MTNRGRWPGTWAAVCDRCGFRFPSDQLVKDWTGLMVCHKDYEARHPQDFVRGVPDNQTPPWTRPEPDDMFREQTCDFLSSTAYAEIGTADCARVGFNPPFAAMENFSIPMVADIAIANQSIANVG